MEVTFHFQKKGCRRCCQRRQPIKCRRSACLPLAAPTTGAALYLHFNIPIFRVGKIVNSPQFSQGFFWATFSYQIRSAYQWRQNCNFATRLIPPSTFDLQTIATDRLPFSKLLLHGFNHLRRQLNKALSFGVVVVGVEIPFPSTWEFVLATAAA